MTGIITKIYVRMICTEITTIGSIRSAILYSKGRIRYVDCRAIHITTVCSVNQKGATTCNIYSGLSCFIQLDALPFFSICLISMDLKGSSI